MPFKSKEEFIQDRFQAFLWGFKRVCPRISNYWSDFSFFPLKIGRDILSRFFITNVPFKFGKRSICVFHDLIKQTNNC